MNYETVEIDARRYAFLHHLGPYPEIGKAFGKLVGIAGPAGLIGQPGALFVGVYHDDPAAPPAEGPRSDAGITVAPDAAIPEGLQEGTLPAGRYAKAVHVGGYERMGESWERFWDAVLASGVGLRHVSPFELYISDMDATPKDELVTELYIALE